MVTYSIDKTNANIGETITLSRSNNVQQVTSTYWIIDFQPSDYNSSLIPNPLNNDKSLTEKGKVFCSHSALSETVTIQDKHTIAHTLTPITVGIPTTQYLNSMGMTPINELQGNSTFTVNIGETIEVNFNRNIYNQLKFLVNRWTKGKEDTSHKVTSISSSSTNVQYPSAKAVDTYVTNAMSPKGIEFGDDLDDYWGIQSVGEYYCPTDNIAQSLTNSPVDVAFTMKVEYNGYNGNGVKQTVSDHINGSSYFRTLYYVQSTNEVVSEGWKKWYENTAWQNLSFSSGYANYETNNRPVRYKRMNKIVHIEGIFKNTSAVTPGENGVIIGDITDETCRPTYDQYSLQQGSGANKFLLVISPNGNVSVRRYGTTTTSTQMGATTWIHCNTTWFVD